MHWMFEWLKKQQICGVATSLVFSVYDPRHKMEPVARVFHYLAHSLSVIIITFIRREYTTFIYSSSINRVGKLALQFI